MVLTMGSRLLLALVLALAGCSSARMTALNARLGLRPMPAQSQEQVLVPALADKMDRLYRTGAESMQRGDLDAAMDAWRQYADIAPTHLARTQAVRGYLTLLQRETARRFAKQAVAAEQAGGYAKTDRFHVALLPFRSSDDSPAARAKPFNRAIQAMVATDLAQVPALTLLERNKMDYLLREMKLGESGLLDPASAAKAGRMLGAGSLVSGVVFNEDRGYDAYSNGYTGRYTIGTVVSDVEQGRVVGSQEASGWQYNYFELEKKIVHGILDTLNIKDIPASVDRIHTKNWDAYARFTQGLKMLDEGKFAEARREFYAALTFDPEFDMAEQAYLDTPPRDQTIEEMQAEVARGL